MADDLTAQTVELLQAMIRSACVNDGTAASGQEVRNADLLTTVLEGAGLDLERYEPTPGRTSLVARIEGTDPDAPSLMFCGHTDTVGVEGMTDPWRPRQQNGRLYGRGAQDMKGGLAAMIDAARMLANDGFASGRLIVAAVMPEMIRPTSSRVSDGAIAMKM